MDTTKHPLAFVTKSGVLIPRKPKRKNSDESPRYIVNPNADSTYSAETCFSNGWTPIENKTELTTHLKKDKIRKTNESNIVLVVDQVKKLKQLNEYFRNKYREQIYLKLDDFESLSNIKEYNFSTIKNKLFQELLDFLFKSDFPMTTEFDLYSKIKEFSLFRVLKGRRLEDSETTFLIEKEATLDFHKEIIEPLKNLINGN